MSELTERTKKYLEEYDGPEIRIMEVCGTHTHEIFRQGIRRILSPKISLISDRDARCASLPSNISMKLYISRLNQAALLQLSVTL